MNETIYKLQELKNLLRQLHSVVVALSGGVDSSFLSAVAFEVLQKNAIAVTGISPSLSKKDLEDAKKIAKLIGIEHILLPTNEIFSEEYRKNSPQRCYFCKRELYKILKAFAKERGIFAVVDGCTMDDTFDYRPGRTAALELNVRSPLFECNLGKEEIRELCKLYALPLWNKPSSPCLSSRFAYGTEITENALRMVEKAENILYSYGFSVVRARFHKDLLRIEVPSSEINKFFDYDIREKIIKELKNTGFKYITLDLEGFRSGSLNEILLLKKN